MTTFAIRGAGPDDMSVLREVFRRSSLSNEGDRVDLLAILTRSRYRISL